MKKKILITLTLVLAFSMTACGTKKEEKTIENINETQIEEISTEENTESEILTYKSISMQEGQSLIETETNYIILDVRTIEEFDEGHIPGAVCIPNENIGSEKIEELPNKNQLILVYCRSGNRSKQASEKLINLGYTNIVEFGGIIDYTGEIEKTEPEIIFEETDIEEFNSYGHYVRGLSLYFDEDEKFDSNVHDYILNTLAPAINECEGIKYMGHQEMGNSIKIYIAISEGTSSEDITQQAVDTLVAVHEIWYSTYGQNYFLENFK